LGVKKNLSLSIEVTPLLFGANWSASIVLDTTNGLAIVRGARELDLEIPSDPALALAAVADKAPALFKLPLYEGVTITCSKSLEKPLLNLLTWRHEAIDATEELEVAVENTDFATAFWTIAALGHDLEKLLLIVNGKQWLILDGKLYEASKAPTEDELEELRSKEIKKKEQAEKRAIKKALDQKKQEARDAEQARIDLVNKEVSDLPDAILKLAEDLDRAYFSGFERKHALQKVLSASRHADLPELKAFIESLPSTPIAKVTSELENLASAVKAANKRGR
jgi:hypothetical protein